MPRLFLLLALLGCVPQPSPVTLALRSRDTFTGGNTSSLTGRTPDGGGNPTYALGTWQAPAAIPGTGFSETIGIESGVARLLFTGEPTGYQDVPLAVPGLPAKGYRAEKIAVFPLGTSDGGYSEVGVSHQVGEETAYTFQVGGGGADDITWTLYEVKTTAGVTFYTRLADLAPATIALPQGNPVTFSLELTTDDTLIGVIQGATVVTFDLVNDNALDLGTPVPSILPAGLPALDLGDSADSTTPPGVTVTQFSVYFGPCMTGTGGDEPPWVSADGFSGGDDPEISGRTPDGDGDVGLAAGTMAVAPWWSSGSGTAIGIDGGVAKGTGVDFSVNSGFNEVRRVITGLGLIDQSMEKTFVIDDGFSDGFNYAVVLVRASASTPTGFSARFEDAGLLTLSSDLSLTAPYGYDLKQVSVPLVYGTPYRLKICAIGNRVIVRVNDVSYIDVDATDTFEGVPEGTDLTHPTGDPGFGLEDAHNTDSGLGVRILSWRAAAACDAAPCTPCVPGGGTGGGGPGGGSTEAFVWVMKNGSWRQVPVPNETSDKVQVQINGAWRPARRGWVMVNGAWREMGQDTTFVLDPDDFPDTPGLPCEGVVDPFPPPTSVGTKAFGLYNLTKNLLDQYPPFNGAITGSSVAALPALLAAIAARSFQLWFVPAWRNEQTQNNSGQGKYDHTSTMAKFATFAGFSDVNQGVIPFCIAYDEPLCGPCWQGVPPTQAQVKEGCALVTTNLGVPCAIRMSPLRMLNAGWTPGAGNIRIGMAQYGGRTGYGAEGFPTDYDGYIAAQISAATTLGLDGILWGLNPYRSLKGGWLPEWTDSYLETVGLKAAAAGMNYGVYMWLGYPPSTKVLIPGTNAKLQIIAAAL